MSENIQQEVTRETAWSCHTGKEDRTGSVGAALGNVKPGLGRSSLSAFSILSSSLLGSARPPKIDSENINKKPQK